MGHNNIALGEHTKLTELQIQTKLFIYDKKHNNYDGYFIYNTGLSKVLIKKQLSISR